MSFPRLRFRMLRVVLSAVLLLLVTSITSTIIFASVSSTPYINREHDFHIYPPSGWEVDESTAASVPGAVVLFWGPYESETGGTVNIMISSKTVASTISLEEYVSDEKDSLTSLPGYRILSESRREINELPCIELVGTGVGTTNLGSFSLKQKQVVFVENGKVYWLSFMASTKYYEMYLPAFEESLQTFGLGLPEVQTSTGSQTTTTAIISAIIVTAIIVIAALYIHRRRKSGVIPRTVTVAGPAVPTSGVTRQAPMRTSELGRWLGEEIRPQKESYFEQLCRTGRLWEEVKEIQDEKPHASVGEPPGEITKGRPYSDGEIAEIMRSIEESEEPPIEDDEQQTGLRTCPKHHFVMSYNNQEQRYFCSKCDREIETLAVRSTSPEMGPTKFCRECGAKIPRDSIYCEECGTSLA